MKFLGLLILVLSSFFDQTQCLSYQQTGVYLEYDFDYQNMDQEILNGITSGFNRFFIGFYFSQYGCWAACDVFVNLASKQQVLDDANAQGAKILLAVGGPTESPEYVIDQGWDYVTNFAANASAFAMSQGFHGIDFGVHLAGDPSIPSPYANDGSLAQYIQTLVTQAKQAGFTSDQIYISGQAPYFSPQFTNNTLEYSFAYSLLDSNADESFYAGNANLVMFNEGKSYQSATWIFTHNDDYPGSSIQEVMNLGGGITKANLIVEKPVPVDGVGVIKDGFVDPVTLGQWACSANDQFGWNTGFTGWTWNQKDEYDVLEWPADLSSQC